MNLSFSLPIKPISVNKAYYKRNNQLTKEARECRLQTFKHLVSSDTCVEQLKLFRASFKDTKHQLSVSYSFKVPKKILFKPNGAISMKSGDVDNYIKVLNDFLFNEKYFGDESRYDFKTYNIGIDDRFVTKLTAVKVASLTLNWSVDVQVRMTELDA